MKISSRQTLKFRIFRQSWKNDNFLYFWKLIVIKITFSTLLSIWIKLKSSPNFKIINLIIGSENIVSLVCIIFKLSSCASFSSSSSTSVKILSDFPQENYTYYTLVVSRMSSISWLISISIDYELFIRFLPHFIPREVDQVCQLVSLEWLETIFFKFIRLSESDGNLISPWRRFHRIFIQFSLFLAF